MFLCPSGQCICDFNHILDPALLILIKIHHNNTVLGHIASFGTRGCIALNWKKPIHTHKCDLAQIFLKHAPYNYRHSGLMWIAITLIAESDNVSLSFSPCLPFPNSLYHIIVYRLGVMRPNSISFIIPAITEPHNYDRKLYVFDALSVVV